MAEETKDSQESGIHSKINQLFAGVGKLTRLQRILICLGSILVIGAGYYYFVFSPRHEALSTARAQLKRQQNQLASFKRQAKFLGKYEKEMAEVQEEFHIAMKALPEKKEVPDLLKGVSRAGANAGLAFLLFQPEPVIDKEFYKEIPLSIEVNGRYHQVADFFYQIAGLNRIVNVRNMSMVNESATKKGRKKKAGKSNGMVQMKCSAVTYMFAEPEAEESKGKKNTKKKKKG